MPGRHRHGRRRSLEQEDEAAEKKEHHKGVGAAKVAHPLRVPLSVCLSTLALRQIYYSNPKERPYHTIERGHALSVIYTRWHSLNYGIALIGLTLLYYLRMQFNILIMP